MNERSEHFPVVVILRCVECVVEFELLHTGGRRLGLQASVRKLRKHGLVEVVIGVMQLKQLGINLSDNLDEANLVTGLTLAGGQGISSSADFLRHLLRGGRTLTIRRSWGDSGRDAAPLAADFIATPPHDDIDQGVGVIDRCHLDVCLDLPGQP